MRFRSLKVGGAALLALSLAACSSAGPAPSSPSGGGSDQTAKEGGIAVVALSDEPDVLDPTLANTYVARVVFTSFCEKLYDTNDKLDLVPQLAADLPVISDDGLTVDIKLREGIKFNDGTPFNADAVKTTLKRNMTLPTSARKKELAAVDKVEVIDPANIRLTLSTPYSPLGAQLADRAGAIMSPAALDELGEDFGTAPVCVGPFAFKDRVAGSEINFVKSDEYYDADKVHLDGVTYKFITDPNVRAANLRSGDVNTAGRLNASDAVQLENEPDLEILKVGTIAYQALSINVDPEKSNSPLATSPELRKAFELSINRDAINTVVFDGQNIADCLPLPAASSFRPDQVECPAFDPDAARKMVEASGETMPVPVELMIPARPTDQKVGEVIQSMANAAGFAVTLKPVEFVSSLDAARAGDFDMFLIGWSGRIDPDGNLTDLVTTDGSNNFSQLSDPELDGMIADASKSGDPAERKAMYAKVLDRLADIVPNIYLYHDTWFLGLSGITDVVYPADSIPRFKTASLTE